jgi:ATP-dependent helicase/DNAse subunit B
VLVQLGSRRSFAVTELERFADCSSAWFVERFLSPRTIDAEPDAMQRGSVAHTALHRFFARVPAELGVEKLEPGNVEDAKRLMRQCLDEALGGVRMELTDMQLRELDQTLWRDLEAVVEEECESGLSLVPRRFEVAFGSERAAPELQRGLELGPGVTLSGKIDRIDVDPFGARGIVQDYKSGRHAHSAAEIERELRLQVPLYMLVLRDLVGLEPLGGLYRPLAGTRRARGLVRAEEAETLPGYVKSDYLDEEAFWGVVESARDTATVLAGRIQEGDVHHDPRGGDCPAWCDLWSMCRIERP